MGDDFDSSYPLAEEEREPEPHGELMREKGSWTGSYYWNDNFQRRSKGFEVAAEEMDDDEQRKYVARLLTERNNRYTSLSSSNHSQEQSSFAESRDDLYHGYNYMYQKTYHLPPVNGELAQKFQGRIEKHIKNALKALHIHTANQREHDPETSFHYGYKGGDRVSKPPDYSAPLKTTHYLNATTMASHEPIEQPAQPGYVQTMSKRDLNTKRFGLPRGEHDKHMERPSQAKNNDRTTKAYTGTAHGDYVKRSQLQEVQSKHGPDFQSMQPGVESFFEFAARAEAMAFKNKSENKNIDVLRQEESDHADRPAMPGSVSILKGDAMQGREGSKVADVTRASLRGQVNINRNEGFGGRTFAGRGEEDKSALESTRKIKEDASYPAPTSHWYSELEHRVKEVVRNFTKDAFQKDPDASGYQEPHLRAARESEHVVKEQPLERSSVTPLQTGQSKHGRSGVVESVSKPEIVNESVLTGVSHELVPLMPEAQLRQHDVTNPMPPATHQNGGYTNSGELRG